MFQVNPEPYFHVTCAVYNYNGTEIIGSYNDDDIYLFDTRLPSESDYIYRYEGHRNSITGEFKTQYQVVNVKNLQLNNSMVLFEG